MLEVRNLSVAYGQHRALEDVSIRVEPGEIVVILGANGAGKSTLLGTIAGIGEGKHDGGVYMDGHPILGTPAHRIVEHGIALVPEGRGIFGDMTVRENLLLGAFSDHARDDGQANLERVFSLFPKLRERQGQVARTMSGGEQQMVAIGRAAMSAPRIMMLDEPSLGLSPLLCKELFHSLGEVRRAGLGILLVEQNAKQSLAIADRGYLLENAHIVHEDTAANLIRDPAVQKAYLGAGGAKAETPRPAASPGQPAPAEIAAQALESLAKAPKFPLRPKAPARARADDLIHESIDDLVRRASRAPAPAAMPMPRPAVNPAAPAPRPVPATAGNDRLREVLEEIEQAAARARTSRPAAFTPYNRKRDDHG